MFNSFTSPKFALTYVEFALTSSRYSYGINPIVGIRLNVEYMLVIIIIIIIIIIMLILLRLIVLIKNNNNNNKNNIIITTTMTVILVANLHAY